MQPTNHDNTVAQPVHEPCGQLAGQAVTDAATQTLPESWPDQAPGPVRVVWIPGPFAVVLVPLLWLMPKRFGPHFAATSLVWAIIGQIVWTFYAASTLLMMITIGPDYSLVSWLLGRSPEQRGWSLFPPATLGEILRGPIAFLVSGTAEVARNGGSATLLLTRMLVMLLFVEMIVFLLAGLLMPLIACGETARRLLGRSVRLVLWASTSLMVLALAVQCLLVYTDRQFEPAHMGLLVSLYCAWFLWLVIRGGSRYAGPAEGPAWEPQTPLCAGCGYGLTALRVDGDCPECGRPIRRSLPEYREPSPFTAARSNFGRLVAFPRTYWQALWDRGFYDRLQVRDGFGPARSFAGWTCVLTSGLLAIPVLTNLCSWVLTYPPTYDAAQWGWILATAIWIATGLMCVLSLLSLLLSRFGRRAVRKGPIAVFYWSAWLLPLGAASLATTAACTWLLRNPVFSYTIRTPAGPIDFDIALVCLLALIPLLLHWRALARLARAVRSVRYA